ncbi:hypothetical protein ACB098_09G087700 [Castanea mollissima]
MTKQEVYHMPRIPVKPNVATKLQGGQIMKCGNIFMIRIMEEDQCGNYAQFHGYNIIEFSHEVPYSLCIIITLLTILNLNDTFNHIWEFFQRIISVQITSEMKVLESWGVYLEYVL